MHLVQAGDGRIKSLYAEDIETGVRFTTPAQKGYRAHLLQKNYAI